MNTETMNKAELSKEAKVIKSLTNQRNQLITKYKREKDYKNQAYFFIAEYGHINEYVEFTKPFTDLQKDFFRYCLKTYDK